MLDCAATSTSALVVKLCGVSTSGDMMDGIIHARRNMTRPDGRTLERANAGCGAFKDALVASYRNERVARGWGNKADRAFMQFLPEQ